MFESVDFFVDFLFFGAYLFGFIFSALYLSGIVLNNYSTSITKKLDKNDMPQNQNDISGHVVD